MKEKKVYDLSKYGQKVLWIDTETTGLEPETDFVVQIAAIPVISGVAMESFRLDLICPPNASIFETEKFKEAAEVTGLTEELLRGVGATEYTKARAMFAEFVLKYVNKYDKTDKFVFAGYNPRFDMDFMKKFWPDQYFFGSFWVYPYDVMPFAIEAVRREASIGNPVPQSLRLGDIAAWLDVKPVGGLHDAYTDISLTMAVLHELMARFFNAK